MMDKKTELSTYHSFAEVQRKKVLDICKKLNALPLKKRQEIVEEEYVDTLRICDACGKAMCEGYCIDDGREHFCDEKCLYSWYSVEDYNAMSDGEESTSYYTTWWENYRED